MHELKGFITSYIYISDNKNKLAFINDRGDFHIYHIYCDCCARSYCEDIINPEFLIGNKIIDVIEREYIHNHHEGSDSDNPNVDVFGYGLVTTVGITDIILHCEHNGYYKGDLYCFDNECLLSLEQKQHAWPPNIDIKYFSDLMTKQLPIYYGLQSDTGKYTACEEYILRPYKGKP